DGCEHVKQSTRPNIQCANVRRGRCFGESPVAFDAQGVIDMKQPPECAAQRYFMRSARKRGNATSFEKVGPAPVVGVNVLQLDPGLVEEVLQRERRVSLGDTPQLLRAGP